MTIVFALPCWRCGTLFDVAGDDRVEVWHMLRSRRDVPTTLTDDTR